MNMNIPKDFLENIIRKEIYKIMTGNMSNQSPNREDGEKRDNQMDTYTMLGKMMMDQRRQESQWGGQGRW